MAKPLSPLDLGRYRAHNRDAFNNWSEADLDSALKELREKDEDPRAYSKSILDVALRSTRAPNSQVETFYTKALADSFANLDERSRVAVASVGGIDANPDSALFRLCCDTVRNLTNDPSQENPSDYLTGSLFTARRNTAWERFLLELHEKRLNAMSPEDQITAVELGLEDVKLLHANEPSQRLFKRGRVEEYLQKKLKELKAATNGVRSPSRPETAGNSPKSGNNISKPR